MTPTHTHAHHGGRYTWLAELAGGGSMAGKAVVTYHDLGKDLPCAVDAEEWHQHWLPIAPDDCRVCLGAGTDQIKGNKDNPCGGCYGLGKVRPDGETPTELWELADIADAIIQRLRNERDEAQRQLSDGDVQALLKRKTEDATTRHEQQWRAGRGYGPGGQRMTGD